ARARPPHRHPVRPALAALVRADHPTDPAPARTDLPARRRRRPPAHRRACRAARRDRPDRPAGALALARPADALRARRDRAARARGALPRRAHDRPRPDRQAAVPRDGRAPERGARHDRLSHLARRGRHRARGRPGGGDQPRHDHLRRPGGPDAALAAADEAARGALRGAAGCARAQRRAGDVRVRHRLRPRGGYPPAVRARGARRAARQLRDRGHLRGRPTARAGHLGDLRGADMSALFAQVHLSARRTLRQPGELAVRVTFYAVILVIFSALWSAATKANGGEISGYTAHSLLWYVAAAEGSVIATKPRMIETIGWDISSGAIVTEMLRPASVVGLRLAAELGEALVRLVASLAVGGVIVWLYVGPPPSAAGIALFVPASLLAVGCNLAAQHAFAGAAFWLRDARSTWFLYQKLV